MQTLGGGKNEAITGKDKETAFSTFPYLAVRGLGLVEPGWGWGCGRVGGKWRAEEVGGLLFRWEHSWSKIHEFKPDLPPTGLSASISLHGFHKK